MSNMSELMIDKMNHEKILLNTLEHGLKNFDWFYMFSDDYKLYNTWKITHEDIQRLIDSIIVYAPEKVTTMIKQYRPNKGATFTIFGTPMRTDYE